MQTPKETFLYILMESLTHVNFLPIQEKRSISTQREGNNSISLLAQKISKKYFTLSPEILIFTSFLKWCFLKSQTV